MSAGASWFELAVEADHEAVEQVSEILSRACPGGVSIEAPFVLVDEGLGARVDSRRPAILRGYVSASEPAAAQRAIEQVERDLGHLQAFDLRPIGNLSTRVVYEEDWAQAWKEHFPVLRVGQRLVICPTWREHDPGPDDVVLRLDPGMAFGTGLHPTTRLCLAELERLADDGRVAGASVLDVGCGSGILGIAAALFGARRVLGVDTDPLAVEVTLRNAALNQVADFVEARTGSLPLDLAGRYEVVLANLIASVLIDLGAELAAVLDPERGLLLASGIFIDREADVRSAFAAAGLSVVGRSAESDWVALVARRDG